MNIKLPPLKQGIITCFLFFTIYNSTSQVIISQYYEGSATNNWIELTNMGSTSINTASPQLKLGIWSKSGTTGTIAFSGSPTATLNLNVVIPAYSSILIGNTNNGTGVSYLTSTSASQTDTKVMSFNGNDGIALLNSSNTILDRFGSGINAADISYVRNTNVLSPTSTFSTSQWTTANLSAVNTASTTSPIRLKYHIAPPCATPASQPSALLFSTPTTTAVSGSFSPTVAGGYLVVYSTAATLTSLPVNGTTYSAGATLGNAIVVSSGTTTSFNFSGLTANTTYYVSVFAYNNTSCTGGPNYRTTTPLTGGVITALNDCLAPTSSPTNLAFGTPTISSVSGFFTASVSDGYLIVYSTAATLTSLPVNGSSYAAGSSLGNATVVSSGAATSFNLSGLATNTTYYVSVFAYNNTNCKGGPVYNTSSLSGNFNTASVSCSPPIDQPSALMFTNTTNASISGNFTSNTADGYLMVYSTSPTLTDNPVSGTTYTTGMTFGNAIVLKADANTTFAIAGLTPSTTYYVFIYSYNNMNCSGGPAYNMVTPLSGSTSTLQPSLHYYFGNFHSHSGYSDGTGLPSGDFTFGDTANCMDFLGISEHNHVSAGMSLANYALGLSQAAAATTPSFLAMYGMEWGVISTGGHVVVYGVDKLIGWDTGQYDIYVPQTNYTSSTGLFNVINSYSSSNAFATLAHPSNTDFNGIMSTYDSSADDAIVGSGVENGPSTSTNITYTDPPASMAYLSYYRNMLARGYHLGPTIDHDNHNITHGHTATSRTVVLANSLTQNDVLGAMRAMRFYASEDCNAYVNFNINNQPLGSIMTAAGAPTITVTTSTSSPVTSIKIYSGIAGSGSNATILTSTTTGSITYSDLSVSNLNSRYYYVDITESDGKRIVTAPIWYSRNDAAKRSSEGNITEFFTIAESKRVMLKWHTTNEKDNQSFMVERSYDALNFEPIETQIGKGATSSSYYTAIDESSQNEGIVYYRLTHFDAEHNVVFTSIKKVMRKITPKFQGIVYPNPVTENATLRIENANGEVLQLKIYDVTGKLVYSNPWQTTYGDQEIKLPLQKLTSGIYLLTAQSGEYSIRTKITKY